MQGCKNGNSLSSDRLVDLPGSIRILINVPWNVQLFFLTGGFLSTGLQLYPVGRRRADQREPIFFSADHGRGNNVHSAVISHPGS
eukprot:COSAG02_NODE_1518_length_12179_cov_6.141060_2_plen_85_part_00